jgi:amino acid adenylation domain-containing protein
LLQRRLQARAAGATTIPRRPEDSPPVLSDAQRQLLLLDATNEGLTAYNVAQALRIEGDLDLDALRQAFGDLAERHAVLRTRYFLRDGVPCAAVDAPGPVDVAVTLLDSPSEVDEFVRKAVSEPIDLASGKLLRARVATLGPDRHVLVIITHHIVSDAVSKQVLGRELNDLYVARRDGTPSTLPALRIDYADYAVWQVERPNAQADLDWWRENLAGAPDQTELPTDRARSSKASFDGAKHVSIVDAALLGELRTFAAEQRATLFMVLLAAYAGLLNRHTGQDDIVVGSPTSGRHHDELADVVGLFLTMLPLRLDLDGDPTFRELVGRVQNSAAQAFRHQDVSFEGIVDAVRPERVPGRNPLFQSSFTFRSGSDGAPTLDGLRVTPIAYEGGWTKFDLAVICFPRGDGLGVLWQYATTLFDEATIVQLGTHFEALLRAGLAKPDLPLSALPLASPQDVQAIERCNATDVDVAPALIHELFAAQVRLRPEAPAVGDRTGWITYRELDRRADVVAHHLVSMGVGPDVRVAIFLNRSIELEVAILAVLKAGGAYVPLDTGYPSDRLEYMIDNSAALTLITSEELRDSAPQHANNVVIEDILASGVSGDDGPPVTGVQPNNLAYVLYTSGTTGRPKGVQIEHTQLINQLNWTQTLMRVGPDDVLLQKSPISFDASCWEVLLGPTTGAKLYMADPGGHMDPGYLADIIAEQNVTVAFFVPSMLDVFLSSLGSRRLRSLRVVFAGGETLSDDIKNTCLSKIPDAELWNVYGPTETTIVISCQRCAVDQEVTIGRPMQNCKAYVLDSGYNHQPVGMPGELYIGGPQVARGYLNRPELTDERFLTTPLGRLYRTGDRVVLRPDGQLQFLGRIDQQVKLRGLRIELGEIESVLGSHPAVHSACAAVGVNGVGTAMLAGFVTLRPELEVDGSGISDDWRQAQDGDDPEDAISALTGRSMNEPEMREWLGTTVDRIAGLEPRSILEVGTRSGHLMWRLAPRVEHYDATDVSEEVIDRLKGRAVDYPNVTLRVQPPDAISAAVTGRRYDCVVLNSLVQRLPDAGYLGRVVEHALEVTAEGGTIFVGDVPDLRLADAFALEVARAQGRDHSVLELRTELTDARSLDTSLRLDPALLNSLPGVGHVQILPRMGHEFTETNRFHFDAILHPSADVAADIADWLDWDELGSLEALTAELRTRAGGEFGVTGVPNNRTAEVHAALAELAAGRAGSESATARGFELDQVYGSGVQAGYRVEFSCARDPWTVDVAFTQHGRPTRFAKPDAPDALANDPRGGFARAQQRDAITTELFALLRERLPQFMVPNSLRMLASLPYTPTGKLDRRALEQMGIPASRHEHIAPRTPTEIRVAELWRSALGVERDISIEDDFFDLGGSSLLAVSLFPRLEREFRVKLDLAMLFENVTVASIAKVIDTERSSGPQSWDLAVPMRTTGHKRPLFVMPDLRGDVLPYRQLVGALDSSRPVYGLQCRGLDGVEQPRTSLSDVATDCREALQRIQPHGPYLLAGYCFGGVVAFDVARQLIERGEQVEFLGVIDAVPFGRGGNLTPSTPRTLRQRLTWSSRAELEGKITFVRRQTRQKLNVAVTNLSARLGKRTPRRFVDVFAVNLRASDLYVTPDVPVAVDFFRASSGNPQDDELRRQRWELVAGEGARMHVVSGQSMNHKRLIRESYAPLLAASLDASLKELD